MNIAVPSSCHVCTMAPPSPDAALWGCQLCLDQSNGTTTMNKTWKDWWTSSQSCTQMRLAKLRMSTSKDDKEMDRNYATGLNSEQFIRHKC